MPGRTINGALNGNDEFWSNDPNGVFFNGNVISGLFAPNVTTVSAQGQTPAIGSTVTTTFTSDQPGFWGIASKIPGATIMPTADFKGCTITWTPQAYPVCAIYISAVCWNYGGFGYGHCLYGPGMRGQIIVGPGIGADYPDPVTCYAALEASGTPGGWLITIEDGTYNFSTDPEFFVYRKGTSTQTHMPPSGEYTEATVGTDKVYTITRFTSLCAQTPFGVTLDCENLGQALYLHGNTDLLQSLQDRGWDNGGSLSASQNRRGIHIAGFNVKNIKGGVTEGVTDANIPGDGVNAYHCDHIFCEYLTIGLVSDGSSSISFHNSRFCVGENIWSYANGRYKHGTYQSVNCIYRETWGRFDQLLSSEPHAGTSFYRANDCYARQSIHMDTDQFAEFNTSVNDGGTASQDAGFMALPSTSDFTFPKEIHFENFLMLNSQLGLIESDARDIVANFDTFPFVNVAAWDYTPNVGSIVGKGLSTDGPIQVSKLTSVNCDTTYSDYGTWAYRQWQTFDNFVLKNFGYSDAGTTPNGVGVFAWAEDVATKYVHFTNGDIYHNSYSAKTGGASGAVTFTNVREDYADPSTLGMIHPGRMEPGSEYATLGYGQDNLFFNTRGRRGYTTDISGYDDYTYHNWLEEMMAPLACAAPRNYSWTGATMTLGTQTLSGNRGGVQADKLVVDYILSNRGQLTPFPLGTDIKNISGPLACSLRPFADAYMTNITGFKIYLDGGLAQVLPPQAQAVIFDGLISGRTYKMTIVAVDSVLGESVPSYELQAAA